MTEDSVLPFTWAVFIKHTTLPETTYYNVIFKKDFGVIKAGWAFEYVSVDYGAGIVIVKVDNKEVTQFFKLEPIYTRQ